jgi:hypothetical protein
MRAILATCILLLAIPAQADTAWTTFVDPSRTFSVSVPQRPVASSEDKSLSYMIDLGPVALLMKDDDFGDKRIDPTAALNAAATGMGSEGRTVISTKTIFVDGHEGRDIVATDSDGATLEDCVFFFGDHLYQFMTVRMKEASSDTATYPATFSASVHFLR